MLDFDPYREWLGVQVEGRRPDHYELLALRRLEGDADLIRSAADAKINLVRHVRPGPHLDLWQRMLDELTEARRCLTDPVQKQRYDEQLHRNEVGTGASSSAKDPEQAAVTNPLPPRVATSPAPPAATHPSIVPTPPTSLPPTASQPIASTPIAAAPAEAPNPIAPQIGHYAPTSAAPYPAVFPGYPTPAFMPPVPGTPYPSTPVMPAGYPPLAMAIPVAPAQPPSSPPNVIAGMFPGITPPMYGPPYQMPPAMMPVGTVPAPADPMAPMPGFVPYDFGAGAPLSPNPAGGPYGASLPVGGLPIGGLATGVTPVSSPTSPGGDELLPASPVSSSRRFFTRQRNQTGALVAIAIVGLVVGLGLILLLFDEVRRKNAANRGDGLVTSDESNAPPRDNTSNASVQEAPSRRGAHIVHRARPESDTEREPPNLTGDPPDMPVKPDEKPDTKESSDIKPKPPEPDEPKPEPNPPTPEPTPPPDPPKKQPPVNEVAQMVSALNLAKTALGERRLEEAKAQIDIAGNLAKAANHKAMTHRMGLLHHYVVEFWKAVRESLKTANTIDELEVGATRVAIVAASEERLTIRAAGQNRTYETMSLPAGVAMALATRWLDVKAPSSKIIRGAFHVVDPNGDPAQARRLWEEAKLLGGEVDELIPVLDDKFDVASLPATRATARQAPMPTVETISVAAKQVKEKYSKDIAAAKNKEQKYALVKKLMDDAGLEMPNESYRFALLAEARDQCAAAKFAQLLIQVVDEMERWFKIDTLTVKYESLSKAAATTTPGNARDFAIEALALTEKAIADKRYDVAARAAKVAHSTANRAKDRDLAVKAADKAREIGELTGKSAKPLEKTKPNGKAKPAPKTTAGKAAEKVPFVKPTKK